MNSPLQVLGRHSISVVTPVYNGDASIPELCRRLTEVLSQIATEYEIILVNDGSRDRSWETISELSSRLSAVRGLNLMRNYGQHNALLCGLRAAKYDVIVTVDDDLQHPAEEISRLLEQLEQGFDVVYGAPKEERHGFMRALASRITRLALGSAIGKDLARNVSAFRVFRTQLRDAFADYQTPFVSIDVLLTWATTRFTAIPVAFQPRYSGSSTYTFTKLVRHALDMMTGFSTAPLQLASLIGFGCTLFGLAVFLYVFTRYCLEGSVPGFPFLASIIAIFSGAQLFALAPVFQGDHVPIRRIPEDLDDFAGKHQSRPCKIRARGLTTIPAIKEFNLQRSITLAFRAESRNLSRLEQRCPDFARHNKRHVS